MNHHSLSAAAEPSRATATWFEDDSFWELFYPHLFSADRFAAAPREVEAVLGLWGGTGPAVLDLCCGPGRHAVELARRGFQVTALDRTAALLREAGRRAAAAEVEVELVQLDMRRFVRPRAYDLVVSLGNSFGYFHDPEEDLLVLRQAFQSLRPGGGLVLEVVSKERIARDFTPTVSEALPGGATLVQRYQIADDYSRLRHEWLLIREGVARAYRAQHTLYSGQELKQRLLQAGFVDVRLHGDLAGRPYDRDAWQLVAVAYRPR